MKWLDRDKPKGCIFCGIAKNDPKIPKKVIYKDKLVMVIMNIFPYNVGHLQVVPLRHVEWPEQLSDEEFSHFFNMIKKAFILLRKALNPSGFNAGMNLGRYSGQSISHLHFQIVPRYSPDSVFMESISYTKVMPLNLEQTHKRIMKYADILKK
jgi:ATP adenylyltransferase